MDHVQQLITRGDNPREERAYRDPASIESVKYRIRSEPNHLYEDPDIDEDIVYRIIPGGVVTKRHLEICAEHFSTNYGLQVGHCFMSQWMHGDDRVWWITQLLVLKGYRNQRRATKVSRCHT